MRESLQYDAVCCNVLQCAAECCSVLQCVAVCYSALQTRGILRACSLSLSMSVLCCRACSLSRC